MKSTIKEIQERFDNDVERFASLTTGQQSTVDAVLNMELISEGIAQTYSKNITLLDVGCGAGNYTVKLLTKKRDIEVHLLDLSAPMLERASQRVYEFGGRKIKTFKGDFRTLNLKENTYDAIIATSVLHHLRDDKDWYDNFAKIFTLLKKGGSLWVFDLVKHENENLQKFLYNDLYGQYLVGLKNEEYRDNVFDYIEREDSPRSLMEQLTLLKQVGFSSVDVIHKNLCFASFVAYK